MVITYTLRFVVTTYFLHPFLHIQNTSDIVDFTVDSLKVNIFVSVPFCFGCFVFVRVLFGDVPSCQSKFAWCHWRGLRSVMATFPVYSHTYIGHVKQSGVFEHAQNTHLDSSRRCATYLQGICSP